MDTEKLINEYSSMSEEDLMGELLKVGACSSGKVSASELDGFFNTVSGFLTPEQRSRMRELIAMLKLN